MRFLDIRAHKSLQAIEIVLRPEKNCKLDILLLSKIRYTSNILVSYTGYQPNGQVPISSTDRGIQPVTLHDGTVEEYSPPRRLRTEEIPRMVNDFRLAARNAIEAGN